MVTYNGTYKICSNNGIEIAEVEIVLECFAAGGHPDDGFKIDNVGIWFGGKVSWLPVGDDVRADVVRNCSRGTEAEVIMDLLEAAGAWAPRPRTALGY